MKTKFIIIETTIFVLLLGAGIANGQSSQNTPLNQVSGPAPTASTPQSLNSLNITAPGTGSISNGVTPGSATTLYENLQYTNNGGLVNPPAQVSTASYTLLEPLPCYDSLKNGAPDVNCVNGQVTTIDVKSYVQYMFNLLIAVSAVAAIFMIVFGGFIYMTSDSLNGKSDGKEKIQHAVEGLLMVLCSYLILRTINPQFVNIPNTLVAPLTTKPIPGAISNLLNSLNNSINVQQIASNAAANQKSAQAQLEEAKKTLADLSTQHNNIAEQLVANQNTDGTPLSDSQRTDLVLQSAQLQDQINQVAATQVVQSGSQAFQQEVFQVTQSNTGMTFDQNVANLDRIYQNDAATLTSNGLASQPYTTAGGYRTTAGQELKDQATYAEALVLIQKGQQIQNGNPGAGSFLTAVGSGAATGAIIGGVGGTVLPVVGNIGGAGAGAVVGSVVGAVGWAVVSSPGQASVTINNQKYINLVDTIKDPALKQQLIDASKKS